MHRIDDADRAVDLHGPGKDGFTEGTPGMTAATVVTDDWLNDVQENLAELIEEAGIALVKGDGGQLLAAMQTLAVGRAQGLGASGGELAYVDAAGTPTPKSRTIFVHASEGQIAGSVGWTPSGAGVEMYASIPAGEKWFVALSPRLPPEVTITSVRALLKPGGAHATTTDRTAFNVREFDFASAFASPAAPASSLLGLAGVVRDDGTTNYQVVAMSGVPFTLTAGKVFAAMVHASLTGGDIIYGLEVTFDDPGPRNA